MDDSLSVLLKITTILVMMKNKIIRLTPDYYAYYQGYRYMIGKYKAINLWQAIKYWIKYDNA